MQEIALQLNFIFAYPNAVSLSRHKHPPKKPIFKPFMICPQQTEKKT